MSRIGVAGALVVSLAVVAVSFAQEKTAAPASKPATPAAKPAAPAAKPAAPGAKPAAPAGKAASAAKATSAAPKSGPGSVIGEVIDPACWVINGAKGEAHKECAIACAKAGQTLAILERKTNKVYILASERPGEDPNKGLIDYIGQAVLAKGKIYSRGGLLAIQVASVEPAPKVGAK
ncbi:MAG TPA: hypothetical protein VER77_02510 [Candidatus Dormibacteraeota bacterium]|nr:hypothetical protein [Candidatus Dormibacteraeota bacterium]